MFLPRPSQEAGPQLVPAYIVGDLLAQVSFHQEDLDDLLTGSMQDSGNQWILAVF